MFSQEDGKNTGIDDGTRAPTSEFTRLYPQFGILHKEIITLVFSRSAMFRSVISEKALLDLQSAGFKEIYPEFDSTGVNIVAIEAVIEFLIEHKVLTHIEHESGQEMLKFNPEYEQDLWKIMGVRNE